MPYIFPEWTKMEVKKKLFASEIRVKDNKRTNERHKLERIVH